MVGGQFQPTSYDHGVKSHDTHAQEQTHTQRHRKNADSCTTMGTHRQADADHRRRRTGTQGQPHAWKHPRTETQTHTQMRIHRKATQATKQTHENCQKQKKEHQKIKRKHNDKQRHRHNDKNKHGHKSTNTNPRASVV